MIFQFIVILLLRYIKSVNCFEWGLTNAPALFWHTIASSSDGINVAAVTFDGGIYRSTDYGLQWTEVFNKNSYWTGISSDITGKYLAISSLSHGVYNTRNFGNDWNRSTIPIGRSWMKIASDSTGQYLAVIAAYGPIYYSIDYANAFFASNAPDALWTSIAVSNDGSKMIATAAVADGYADGISSSVDYGLTWSWIPYTSGIMWQSIVMAYGNVSNVVAVSTGGIYLSTDSGITWSLSSAPIHQWTSVTSSSTGQYIVASTGSAAIAGEIYISTDYGTTWLLESAAPGVKWNSLSSDYSGKNIIATVGDVNGGGIYINKLTNVPTSSPTVITMLQTEFEGYTHFPIGGIVGITLVLFSMCLAIVTMSYCYYERKLENASTEGERLNMMEESKNGLLSIRLTASPSPSPSIISANNLFYHSNKRADSHNNSNNNNNNSNSSSRNNNYNNNNNSNNNSNTYVNAGNSTSTTTTTTLSHLNDSINDIPSSTSTATTSNTITTATTDTTSTSVLSVSNSNPYRLSRRVNPDLVTTQYNNNTNGNENKGEISSGSVRINAYHDLNSNISNHYHISSRNQYNTTINRYDDAITTIIFNNNTSNNIDNHEVNDDDDDDDEGILHTTGLLVKSHKDDQKRLHIGDILATPVMTHTSHSAADADGDVEESNIE